MALVFSQAALNNAALIQSDIAIFSCLSNPKKEERLKKMFAYWKIERKNRRKRKVKKVLYIYEVYKIFLYTILFYIKIKYI